MKYWKSLLPVAIILVFLLIMFVSNIGGVKSLMILRSERDELEESIRKLEAQKVELEHQIKLLKEKDPKVIEREARKLGMVFEGETVYRLRYEVLPDSD